MSLKYLARLGRPPFAREEAVPHDPARPRLWHRGPSLVRYRHETDKSDIRIIGPKLIEPVMTELITQPWACALRFRVQGSGLGFRV